MSKKDLFDEPYDEGTLSKLAIFEDYFKEWLPVFIAKEKPIWKELQIFDLFAGEGMDLKGVHGSPMRIISVLNENAAQIVSSGIKVKLIVNEFDKSKYTKLVQNLKSIANDSLYELKVYNSDFSSVFLEYYESMRLTANFLFLDQNGIKEITSEIFNKIISLKQTDVLFFISSSYIRRFGDLDEFKKYLNITKQDLEGKNYYHIHRLVLEYYRSLIDRDIKYYLAPFSIKKPAGIYGLVFCTSHIYGLEKFLNVCWRYDKITGEANFDIDNEKIDLSKPSLFQELNIPTKRQLFEKEIKAKILEKKIVSNIDLYFYTLQEGFLPKDTNKVLKELKSIGKIDFNFDLIISRVHRIQSESLINVK